MSEQQPDISTRVVRTHGLAIWSFLRRLLPFVVTAVVAVLVTLLIQNMLLMPRSPAPQPLVEMALATTPTQTATLRPSSAPTLRPLPTAPPSPTIPPSDTPTAAATSESAPDLILPTATAVLPSPTAPAEDLAALQREMDRLWSAYYLARSANQIADAEAALMVNDLEQVEQGLTAAAALVNRAYEHSAEREKGPISEFRAQISMLHDEVRVRPEGMDQRLRRLRQSMLSFADAGA